MGVVNARLSLHKHIVSPEPSLLVLHRDKTCLRGFANNKGADQPAHPPSLISAFVIRFLKSTIFNLATGERTCNGLAVFWPTMDLAEI